MTDAGWAERMIQFLESVMPLPAHKRRDALVKLSALLDARRKAEHARAIRIVKREMERVKKDQHTYTAGFKMTLLRELQHLLEKLERGRGGKG